MAYEFRTVNDGLEVGLITRATDRRFGYILNDIGSCSFKVPISSKDDNYELNLLDQSSEIRIYKDTRMIWSGVVVHMSDAVGNRNMECKVECKESGFLLKDRYITTNFSNLEGSLIAWDLIQLTQSDLLGVFLDDQVDFGFKIGYLENFKLRNRTYKTDEILKSLKQLTEVIDGGDMEITPTLTKSTNRLFSWYQKRGAITEVKFDFEDNSIASVVRDIDRTSIANYIIGSGNGVSTIKYDTDLDRLKQYKVRQMLYSNKDISVQNTLDEYCEGILNQRKQAQINYTFTTFNQGHLGTFDVGDEVRFRVTKDFTGGRFEVDDYYRVFEIQVSLSDDDLESVKLVVGKYPPNKQGNIQGIIKNTQSRIQTIEKA